jgi:uncharacterized protein
MNSLPITSFVAGIFAVLLVVLSVLVSLRRAQLNAVFGDAGDTVLRRRIRAHGNFVEYAPLAVMVVGLVEYQGAARWLAISLGATFVFSRMLHAIGMLYTSTPVARAIAMLANHVSFVGAGAWLIVSFFQ